MVAARLSVWRCFPLVSSSLFDFKRITRKTWRVGSGSTSLVPLHSYCLALLFSFLLLYIFFFCLFSSAFLFSSFFLPSFLLFLNTCIRSLENWLVKCSVYTHAQVWNLYHVFLFDVICVHTCALYAWIWNGGTLNELVMTRFVAVAEVQFSKTNCMISV